MPKEVIEAIKTIQQYCASHDDDECEDCPLNYWCSKEFGQRPPEEWVTMDWE